ncbi:hypothetical protein L0664_08590 [Octadecabacter sp. G9-8]|uniref:Uncharacterized protein n=1 Tax=Octadecabacter dasysiphoniae TaxID=2909341 RepID=A0ABS9CW00_9RHOB|nr:hypothetical protein [Octadecabacter dasysiphoniae]MCF2871121.1 hypothetical protein [Octadecabacter dasysiphoniae]
MEASQSVPDLVAVAQASAKTHYDAIEQIRAAADDAAPSGAQLADMHTQAAALAALAVDIFAVFEARMQHHFKRGPFSRKLHALLTGAGQPQLAYRIYQFYLAVNVLKHGTGASYRELSKSETHLFAVKLDSETDDAGILIDVTTPDFFDGLTAAILESYHFLER